MDQAKDFDLKTLRLPELRVEVWQGWVFINADENATPLASQLAELADHFDTVRVADMVVFETLEFDSPWNWKVMVDNFLESYHHLGPHQETLNGTFPARATYEIPISGPVALLENPSVVAEAAPFWVVGVFPHALMAVVRGDPSFVAWLQLSVDAVDHFHLEIKLMGLPEDVADQEFRSGATAAMTAIHLEDIPMCEAVWKGLNSRYARPGRLSHLEALNWKFYNYVLARLEHEVGG
jgi:phenylpropionate dioxygenase-like ring-hydroxylating dioxygenase large terminal subunit